MHFFLYFCAIFSNVMRKALIIIGIVLGSLLILLGGATLLLQQSNVQTYIVSKITKQLSQTLQADVEIKRVHYRPLNHLTVDSLYISDQQRDTLLFVAQANISINLLQLAEDRLDLTHIELLQPYIHIHSLNDSTLNCHFLLKEQQQDDKQAFPFRLNIDRLDMSDMRIRYNELLIAPLQLSLALPVFSQDSMDIHIHNLELQAQIDQLDAGFSAKLHGDLDSIFADQMVLIYRDKRIFDGDVAVYHPTDLDALYVQAHCNDLYCNHALLQDFLSHWQTRPVVLPQPVAQLGHVHYRGGIHGRIEHLNLQGAFSTALGAITVNGYVKSDTTLKNFDFVGHLSTNGFQLGRMLNHSDIGEIALQAHVDGKIDSLQLTECIADANIHRIGYKGYTYHDIHFDGVMGIEEVSGKLYINDENISLQVNGLADWSSEDTRLDMTARLADFRPHAIHLTEQYPDMAIGATTYISLFTSGTPQQMLDNLTGYMIIDTLSVINGKKTAVMEQLKLNIDSYLENGKPAHKMNLQSDYLTADLTGTFQYTTLPNTCKQLLHTYIPSLVEAPKQSNKNPNQLEFYAYFRQLEDITQVLELPYSIPSYPTIKGFIREDIQQIGMQAHIPSVQSSSTQIDNLTLSVENIGDSLGMSLYMYNRLPKDNPTAAKIGDVKARAHLKALNDAVDIQVHLDNTDSVQNAGTIHISSQLSQYAQQPLLNVHLHPTHIILNDSSWTINDATITYTAAEKKVDIQNFALNTDYQTIAMQGVASPQVEDSIKVELRNIDLQYLLGYTLAGEAISVQGPLTGKATLYGLFTQPMVEAQVAIPNAGLNGTYLGDLTAQAYLDREEKTIIIEGAAVDSMEHTVVEVQGKVIPENKWWGLDIHCDSVDIGLIDFWTHDIFTHPQGRAFGDLQVFGQERRTWVTAAIHGKDAQVTMPQLGATFYFNDSIYMDSTAIRLPDIDVRDAEGNTGVFSGIITHQNFLNFKYDLNAQVNNMLALNLPYDPQSLFYGKVYGSGNVHITGDDYECKIDVNARTEANSKFYLSVNTASVAANASFVEFKAPQQTDNLLHLLSQPTQPTITALPKRTKLLLSLQLEATPTAEINIKLGGDDGIRGRGEGNLKINYDDSSEEVQMLGTYTLQSGLFSYALGNIVRRNFDIAEGSRVIWSGDPLSPVVDITGRYHTTASLRDLFGSEFSQVATNRTSVPVNCVLYMTDQLFNPTLQFAVELPQSDESIQSQVNSIINTEEMLMRQVIYLLVFNRFYTADYLQNTQTVGLNETYSLLSSTITGQINAWLSKLTDIFTMGFNFRTDGEGASASQEYEANFQLQPIRQLVINGNFGYRYNDLSNRPFFGDLDIEYLLTQNGKLRAKAYTHTVDKYSLKQANTVQGLGLVFKHDFNWGTPKKKPSVVTDTIPTPDIIQVKDTTSTL